MLEIVYWTIDFHVIPSGTQQTTSWDKSTLRTDFALSPAGHVRDPDEINGWLQIHNLIFLRTFLA